MHKNTQIKGRVTLASRRAVLGSGIALIALAGAGLWWANQEVVLDTPSKTEKMVVNEAARTLLYLPLYHAQKSGCFKDNGLDVEIVTGGSATNSVAALISGEADIAQADPMYAPISQSKGSDVVAIGQIVGRVGLWALARPGTNIKFDQAGLKSAKVITHPKPMTSFTYMELLAKGYGYSEKDINFVPAKPGTEVATYNAEQDAPFIVAVEPVATLLEEQKAKIVYSWPQSIGDRVFSGLMATRSGLAKKSKAFASLKLCYQKSLDQIASGDASVQATAAEFFPNLTEKQIATALGRLRTDRVFPVSLKIEKAVWDASVQARVDAGDVKDPPPFEKVVAN